MERAAPLTEEEKKYLLEDFKSWNDGLLPHQTKFSEIRPYVRFHCDHEKIYDGFEGRKNRVRDFLVSEYEKQTMGS